MRIGTIHFPTVQDADRLTADRRPESAVRHGVVQPERDTADLLALSAGLGLRGLAESRQADRQAMVNSLAQAWTAGTFRPNPDRIAEKLFHWGFDNPEAGRP